MTEGRLRRAMSAETGTEGEEPHTTTGQTRPRRSARLGRRHPVSARFGMDLGVSFPMGAGGSRGSPTPDGAKSRVNYSRLPQEEQKAETYSNTSIEMANGAFIGQQRQLKAKHIAQQNEQ
eukprot:10651489-Prorocentrum_lima.AAC.1